MQHTRSPSLIAKQRLSQQQAGSDRSSNNGQKRTGGDSGGISNSTGRISSSSWRQDKCSRPGHLVWVIWQQPPIRQQRHLSSAVLAGLLLYLDCSHPVPEQSRLRSSVPNQEQSCLRLNCTFGGRSGWWVGIVRCCVIWKIHEVECSKLRFGVLCHCVLCKSLPFD